MFSNDPSDSKLLGCFDGFGLGILGEWFSSGFKFSSWESTTTWVSTLFSVLKIIIALTNIQRWDNYLTKTYKMRDIRMLCGPKNEFGPF